MVLDIDDTCDVVHGHQQLSLFHAHYDERCFLPIHVYDAQMGRPVAIVLRPGKTPSGVEVRAHLRRLVRRIPRVGLSRASRSGATVTMPVPKSWTSARRTASATSGLREPSRSLPKFRIWPMRCALNGRWRTARSFAALPRRNTGLEVGRASAGWSPASRPPAWGSTSALSSPTWLVPARASCMKACTVSAARRRTGSSSTRPNSPPTGPRAGERWPTGSGSCCTQRRTG
ncbi:hypothetical protein CEJ86_28590 [Sinorhizobium meliloti]|uniref:Transposase DDE domain-containing protein n=1 Tax=Rhizobium meliloti TaxID=382 RepID=A0A2J0YV02_RHIML|nr:hypothetical protein CEJ86_28590 [Sinorhizobium meliloti]